MNGSRITSAIIRHAIFELQRHETLEGVVARLHPEQADMALELGVNINISSLNEGPEAPMLTSMGGIPLIEDIDIVPNVIRFERGGEVLLRIINLAQPRNHG